LCLLYEHCAGECTLIWRVCVCVIQARRAKDEEALARKEERAREKASRPPRTQGLLFRYVDGKVGAPIERVMTSEEAARAAAEEKAKAEAAEARQAERASAGAAGERRKQRQEEVGKMQDLLRKSGEKEAGPASRRREDRDKSAPAGQTDASKAATAAPVSSGVVFAEPFVGRENTVVVVGGLGVDISESEALVEFTEVKSRRSKSQQATSNATSAPASSSRDKKRPSAAQAPAAKAPAASSSVAAAPSSISPANVPTPARASPPTPVAVVAAPPAKPAWSAPRATLAVIGGAAAPSEEEIEVERAVEDRENRKNKKREVAEAAHTPQKATAAAAPSSDRKKSADQKKGRSPAADQKKASGGPAGGSRSNSSGRGGGGASDGHREAAALSDAALTAGPAGVSVGPPTTANVASTMSEPSLALDSVSMDIHSVADSYPRRNMDSFQIFVPGKGLQASGAANSTASSAQRVPDGSWAQGRVAYVGGPVQEPALFVPGAHWGSVATGGDLHQFSEILVGEPSSGPDRIISW
jgi:hypothetical protein